MSRKAYANAVISAGMAGGIAALAQLSTTRFDLDWRHTGITFAVGSLVGIIQHFRAAPGTYSIPKY
jgi:hypothetical protein